MDINPCPARQVVENGGIWHDPAARHIRAHFVDLDTEPFGRLGRERHLLELRAWYGLDMRGLAVGRCLRSQRSNTAQSEARARDTCRGRQKAGAGHEVVLP